MIIDNHVNIEKFLEAIADVIRGNGNIEIIIPEERCMDISSMHDISGQFVRPTELLEPVRVTMHMNQGDIMVLKTIEDEAMIRRAQASKTERKRMKKVEREAKEKELMLNNAMLYTNKKKTSPDSCFMCGTVPMCDCSRYGEDY